MARLNLSPDVLALNPGVGAVETSDRKGKVPRAGPQPRTGLTSLLLRGWSVTMDAAGRYRLARGEADTGWLPDEKAACDAAKELERDPAACGVGE